MSKRDGAGRWNGNMIFINTLLMDRQILRWKPSEFNKATHAWVSMEAFRGLGKRH
ncbi:hypothetical protein [Candidatus Phycosocius bacilliformis]|uniref:hypothetical protein n=1 Tax=Candidatus Phycosocius bacilliformis TaxID=1445552 RepID=UPI001EDF8A20|nr:hypothetical protein [Candidatus Phycosocius bacilliformis]